MTGSKIQSHGQVRYRVNDANGPDGKRQRKFFETREEAENYIKDRKQDTKTFGVQFITIPPAERAVINHQLDRLDKLGCSLSCCACSAVCGVPKLKRWNVRKFQTTMLK